MSLSQYSTIFSAYCAALNVYISCCLTHYTCADTCSCKIGIWLNLPWCIFADRRLNIMDWLNWAVQRKGHQHIPTPMYTPVFPSICLFMSVTVLSIILHFIHPSIYPSILPYPCIITILLDGITNLSCESTVDLWASCCSADPRRRD